MIRQTLLLEKLITVAQSLSFSMNGTFLFISHLTQRLIIIWWLLVRSFMTIYARRETKNGVYVRIERRKKISETLRWWQLFYVVLCSSTRGPAYISTNTCGFLTLIIEITKANVKFGWSSKTLSKAIKELFFFSFLIC